MIDLNGKTALVLGGSRGIGAASAQLFAEQGADVALTYAASPDRAEKVLSQVRSHGRRGLSIKADAMSRGGSRSAVEKTLAEFGRLDIILASAGTFDTGPLEELDDERYDISFDLHVRSLLEAARAAAPHMKTGGSIISIGSILGDLTPFLGLTLYRASKAAEAGLTSALARELGPRGIRANTIQPGPINTEMNPSDPGQNPMAETQTGQTALGRYGEAREIAALAAFLASDDASYITGQAINVDGGWTA